MGAFPDSIKSILRRVDYGAITAADDRGNVHVLVKLPHQATQFIEGPLPIRHFLFCVPMPTAPVVGWFFEIQDQPQDPLQVDTYFNVLDQGQAKDLERLAHQKLVPLHFVDGNNLSIVATKGISQPPDTERVYQEASACAGRIPKDQYDFDRAKAEFQARHSMAEIAAWQPPRSLPCKEYQEYLKRGKTFHLDDLKAHVKACPQCNRTFGEIYGYVSEAPDPQVSEE